MKGHHKAMPEGSRYGSLVVLKRPLANPLKSHQNLCQCDCGRKVIVTTFMLATGKTTDCGCVKRDRERVDMYPARVTGLDNLAVAIVDQAASDYRKAVMANLKNGSLGDLVALRRFFRSEWCAALTNLDGEMLMRRIEQECIEEYERKKRRK